MIPINYTKDQVEKIFSEAIKAAIPARESKTQELLKKMKEKGRKEEDQCGLSWLNVDEEFCRIVHAMELPGIRTNYNPNTITKFFSSPRIYLEQVIDTQRIGASLAGLEAAAKILNKYGIKAEQEGMLD